MRRFKSIRKQHVFAAVTLVVVAAAALMSSQMVVGSANESVEGSEASSTNEVSDTRPANLAQSDQRTLFDAEQSVIADCMEAEGFQYTPNPWFASEDGSRTPNEQLPQSPNEDRVSRMSEEERSAWFEALNGATPEPESPDGSRKSFEVENGTMSVDLDSCRSQARSAVYGDDIEWQQTLSKINNLSELPKREAQEAVRAFEDQRAQSIARAQGVLDRD